MTGHIFISYSREDRIYAHQLREFLQRAGLPAWTDDSIDYGDRWSEVVVQKIDSCHALVLIMTPAGERSEWVRREINRARQKDRPIRPLLLHGNPFFAVNDLHYDDVRSGQMPSSRYVASLKALAQNMQSFGLASFPVPSYEVQNLAWHPTRPMLTSANGDSSTSIFNISGRRAERVLGTWDDSMGILTDPVDNHCAWSPDGTTLATAAWPGAGATGNLWDARTWQHLSLFDYSQICSLTWTDDGRLLAADSGRIWDPIRSENVLKAPTSDARRRHNRLVPSSKGTYAADIGLGGSVHIWALATKEVVGQVSATAWAEHLKWSWSTDEIWSPDERFLATRESGGIVVWRVSDLVPISAMTGSFGACAWSGREDHTIAVGRNGMVEIYAALTGELRHSIPITNNSDFGFALSWSRDGSMLAIAGLARDSKIEAYSIS